MAWITGTEGYLYGLKLTPAEMFLAAVIAGIAGAAACISVKRKYGMKKSGGKASNFDLSYQAGCRFTDSPGSEQFINEFVTHRIIRTEGRPPKNRPGRMGGVGMVRRSRGGRPRGGRGRRF